MPPVIEDITTTIRCITDRNMEAIGTCFAIGENLFMTAKHALPPGDTVMVSNIVDPNAEEGRRIEFVEAERVWESANHDVAIIRSRVPIITPSHIFRLSPTRPSNQPSLNFTAQTFGYPLPAREAATNRISEFKLRAFSGHVVSGYDAVPVGVNATTAHPLFDVSFPVLLGQSGSPVFDAGLNLMGICIASSEDFTYEGERLADDPGAPVQLFGFRFGVCLNLLDFRRFEPGITTYLANA